MVSHFHTKPMAADNHAVISGRTCASNRVAKVPCGVHARGAWSRDFQNVCGQRRSVASAGKKHECPNDASFSVFALSSSSLWLSQRLISYIMNEPPKWIGQIKKKICVYYASNYGIGFLCRHVWECKIVNVTKDFVKMCGVIHLPTVRRRATRKQTKHCPRSSYWRLHKREKWGKMRTDNSVSVQASMFRSSLSSSRATSSIR